MMTERVTVDFDEKSYYLDGKYWESWDNYGEEMADKINELLDKEQKKVAETLQKHYTRIKQQDNQEIMFYDELMLIKLIAHDLRVDLE